MLLSTNVRSLFPKLDSLCATLTEEGVCIGFISEIWMSELNPLHSQQLERKLHLHGFEFIANPRLNKRGGGVAIVVNLNKGYTVKKLEVNCSMGGNRLEVVWALVTPPQPVGQYKTFICASFYSPPRSRLNDRLLEHLDHNIARLTAAHPRSGIFLCGDRNNIPVGKLTGLFPNMVNIVASPTLGSQILDVIVTDLHAVYDKALVLPPVQPDLAGVGAPSDHSVVIAKPNADRAFRTGFSRVVTRCRRILTNKNLVLTCHIPGLLPLAGNV